MTEQALMVLRYLRGAHPGVDLDLVRSAMDAEYRRGLASRPVPVAGQVAREAAVEAVARWLCDRGPDGSTPWHAWAPLRQQWWRDQASQLLSLPAVSALSAAPQQVMCDAEDGNPAAVTGLIYDGEQDQPADYCDDCARLVGDDFRVTGRYGQESLHEWPCPNCGATTRARMADQQSAVRQAAEVLSDRELGDALDLWWAQREQAETGQEQP